MATSYCFMAVHIVFSTKERYQFLSGENNEHMHQYLGGIIRNIKGEPLMINGMPDHVHVLCLLPKEMSIADFVRTIKANTSKWFREKHNPKFEWQVGYAAFSVSKSSLEMVKQYITDQQKHHSKMLSIDEMRILIEKHGIQMNIE
ncbi:MAG: IS200/IS605 family transposase [Candidatus Cloacimonetes bacterium]|nr:IS200/IS605 family transposase [Candidatus Cloacimonadota bacterium]